MRDDDIRRPARRLPDPLHHDPGQLQRVEVRHRRGEALVPPAPPSAPAAFLAAVAEDGAAVGAVRDLVGRGVAAVGHAEDDG